MQIADLVQRGIEDRLTNKKPVGWVNLFPKGV
jgi:hypothetical protein